MGGGGTSRDNIKGVRVEEIGKPSSGRITPIFLLDIYTSTKHKDYTCLYVHAQDLKGEGLLNWLIFLAQKKNVLATPRQIAI